MPGYSNVVDRWHDEAITLAECATLHLLNARDEVWEVYAEARKAHEIAFNEAFDKAYETLRKKHDT